MTKMKTNKMIQYDDPYFDDFSLDVLRLSHHANQRATERKIPVAELLKPRSHINAYVDKVVSKTGVIITTYPRVIDNNQLPENGRRFRFPADGIGLFIGKQHANIKRTQAEHRLKSLYFDQYQKLIAVAPTRDYDWTAFEKTIETARKRKYQSKQQLAAKKERNDKFFSSV